MRFVFISLVCGCMMTLLFVITCHNSSLCVLVTPCFCCCIYGMWRKTFVRWKTISDKVDPCSRAQRICFRREIVDVQQRHKTSCLNRYGCYTWCWYLYYAQWTIFSHQPSAIWVFTTKLKENFTIKGNSLHTELFQLNLLLLSLDIF